MTSDQTERDDRTIVWSYGGGVQSVGIAALIVQGRLPRPDFIVIADTGREVQSTWDYLAQVIEPAIGPVHIAPHSLATVDLYAFNGDLLIPATTTQSGKVSRLPTFCSNEWKQRVVRRWIRQQGVEECIAWLGISCDEAHRMKDSGVRWLTHAYPLVDLGLRRHDCLRLASEVGWPAPSKSRCYMCPHQNTAEWVSLSQEDRDRAVTLEQEIRARDANVFLHKSAEPLPVALEKQTDQPTLFDGCDSGYCWT